VATEYQLRMYQVTPGRMDEFLAIFPQVVEARRSVGFDVVGAWTVPEENRFVWIISTDGGIEERSKAYYASPQRRAIEPEPAKLLDVIETKIMNAVPMGETRRTQ
jgi:hypothetical protein